MKIRGSIIWLVIIGAVLIGLVLWFGKRKPIEMPTTTSVDTNNISSVASLSGSTTSAIIHTNSLSAQVATHVTTPSKQDKGEEMKAGLSDLNDVPIAFYGRLEDQFGNVISGAQIAASIRIYNDVQSTVEHLTVMSDGNGMFQIKGGKGESLGIMPKKEGYVLASTGTEFKYSYMYSGHFTPDQNNPTVIKMWKLQGAEPLVGIDKDYKLQYIDTPINFDLVAGKIVSAGGDLRITVSRPPGVVSEHNPQDWNIQVEAVDGGLIETSVSESRITFVAPEDGYQPSLIFTMSTTTHSWRGVLDQMFFIKSRKGQVYSKLHLVFGINDAPDGFMDITFNGVTNPNDSRNWEATVPQ